MCLLVCTLQSEWSLDTVCARVEGCFSVPRGACDPQSCQSILSSKKDGEKKKDIQAIELM